MKKNNKGFTLIELLVVIAIIGLLSTLAVVSLNNARIKSRDARRLSDIKQIMTALEMFFTDNNDYPGQLSALTPTFMAAVPTNPTPNGSAYNYFVCDSGGTNCDTTGTGADISANTRSSYTMTYTLEGGVSDIVAGVHCATPAGIAAGVADAATGGNDGACDW